MRLCTKRNISMISKLNFPNSFNPVPTHWLHRQNKALPKIHAIKENIRITKRFYDTFIRVKTGDNLAYLKL